jgi:hypothetical protein
MSYGSAPSPFRRTFYIVLCFYLSFLLDFTAGLYSFDVFRMIQYDKAGAPFGSQRTSVSLQAVSISADIARKMVVAPYEQVDVTLIEEANAKAGGLLILLPPRDVKLQRGVIEKWMEVEAQLNSRELRIPVYFAVVTPEIEEAMSTITSAGDDGAVVSGFLSSIYSDEYVMATSASDPYPITSVSLTNFQVPPRFTPISVSFGVEKSHPDFSFHFSPFHSRLNRAGSLLAAVPDPTKRKQHRPRPSLSWPTMTLSVSRRCVWTPSLSHSLAPLGVTPNSTSLTTHFTFIRSSLAVPMPTEAVSLLSSSSLVSSPSFTMACERRYVCMRARCVTAIAAAHRIPRCACQTNAGQVQPAAGAHWRWPPQLCRSARLGRPG